MHTPRRDASPLIATLVGLAGLAAAMGIGRFAFTPLLPLMQERSASRCWTAAVSRARTTWVIWRARCCASRPASSRACWRAAASSAVAVLTAAMGISDGFAAWVVLRFLAGVASALVFVGVVRVVALGAERRGTRPALRLDLCRRRPGHRAGRPGRDGSGPLAFACLRTRLARARRRRCARRRRAVAAPVDRAAAGAAISPRRRPRHA